MVVWSGRTAGSTRGRSSAGSDVCKRRNQGSGTITAPFRGDFLTPRLSRVNVCFQSWQNVIQGRAESRHWRVKAAASLGNGAIDCLIYLDSADRVTFAHLHFICVHISRF